MAYRTNQICWHVLHTKQPDRMVGFYPEVLGWQPIPNLCDMDVPAFNCGDKAIAHIEDELQPGTGNLWDNYLRVENVAATIERVVEHGGLVISEPRDTPPGRLAVIASPQGAILSLFREFAPTATHHPGGLGGLHSVELLCDDLRDELRWLSSALDMTAVENTTAQSSGYTLVHQGRVCGRAVRSTSMGVPSRWVPWFTTDHTQDATSRVLNAGGTILSGPSNDRGIGLGALVSDPAGAVFGLVNPVDPRDDSSAC